MDWDLCDGGFLNGLSNAVNLTGGLEGLAG